MTLTALLSVLTGVLLLALVLGGMLVSSANRLHRLHVRTDAAWAALQAALDRRAVVARAVTASMPAGESGDALRTAANRAESAPRAEREILENELTGLLAAIEHEQLTSSLAEELGDVEQRVVIARRMYNDAVRDTRTVRRLRTVRTFKLAGRAPTPEYFEIAEPDQRV